MGLMDFSAQYLQRPIPIEGNLIKRDWLKTYLVPPQPQPGDTYVISWDTAMKATSLSARFSKMELDLAARALCQSLDLASGGRERVLDRDLDVHVAPVIGRLVADHDVLVGRNRHPDVDTIDGTVALLRTRRDDGNTTPGNVVLVFLQPLRLMANCCADGL